MHFEYRRGLTEPEIIEQVKELLTIYDDDFYPPLSQRKSSTQSSLGPATGAQVTNGIENYLNALKEQDFILAMDPTGDPTGTTDRVAGFLTFIQHHTCPELGGERHPCTYVTTVLIHKEYRGLRLTYDLYNELFAFVIDEGGIIEPVATRTWECENPPEPKYSNDTHIHILEQLGFKLVKHLRDDRGTVKGQPIDTVYYRKDFSEQQVGLFQRLQSTHTLSAFGIAAILVALTIATAVAYLAGDFGEEGGELLLAFTTSLLVSAVCLIIDAVSQYRLARNEQYLMDMKKFGIDGLNFDKQLLMLESVHHAKESIWLSGCRHILNSSIAAYLQRAVSRGLELRVLSSPPWSEAYKLIYDDAEKTLNNYIKLFRMTLICTGPNACQGVEERCEFRFSEKPFFNDIYRIDDTIITSAFSYCGAKRGTHRDDKTEVTARDFFTLVTHDGSQLFQNMREEYITLWKTCTQKLDNQKFMETFSTTEYRKRTYEENLADMLACLVEVVPEAE